MAAVLGQDSPLAMELQNIVQPKLVEAGWSAGDSTLAEYIVLMLVNGKDKDQVASELANDLLGLGSDDPSAKEFAQWLFDQVAILSGQTTSSQGPAPELQGDAQTSQIQAIPTGPAADSESGMDVEQAHNIPTGPKSMRSSNQGQRGNGRRMPGQVNRALDRNNESILHKVRNNSTERIGRHPPRGPRGGMQHGAPFSSLGGAAGRGAGRNPQISSQQQNQLMQFMNQQMEMMQQMLSGGNPQALMAGMNGAAVNPNFRGRPLADRINGGPRGGGKFGDRRQNQQNGKQNTQSGDTEMGGDGAMETESNTASNPPNPESTVCKFNLKCTKADCPFAHQSPAAPIGTAIDTNDTCSFGAACQNRKCNAKHPSPAKRVAFQAEQECKFWPNCTNPACPFKHPAMPMCKFGGDCNKEDCKFTHVRTVCKYNPCMNPHCYYKHAEGQKKGSTWVKDKDGDSSMAEHVSERKFTSADGDEELIKPDSAANGSEPQQQSSPQQEDIDVVT